MTRIIVCGGRDYADAKRLAEVLNEVADAHPDFTLVHGGAKGADALAHEWALGWGIIEVFRADWAKHGRAAGPIRNRQMLDAGADLVVAFPGGSGTADMVRQARARGVPVREVAR